MKSSQTHYVVKIFMRKMAQYQGWTEIFSNLNKRSGWNNHIPGGLSQNLVGDYSEVKRSSKTSCCNKYNIKLDLYLLGIITFCKFLKTSREWWKDMYKAVSFLHVSVSSSLKCFSQSYNRSFSIWVFNSRVITLDFDLWWPINSPILL